jgi:hypothetical protein
MNEDIVAEYEHIPSSVIAVRALNKVKAILNV